MTPKAVSTPSLERRLFSQELLSCLYLQRIFHVIPFLYDVLIFLFHPILSDVLVRVIITVFLKFASSQLLLLQLIRYIVSFNDAKRKLRHALLIYDFFSPFHQFFCILFTFSCMTRPPCSTVSFNFSSFISQSLTTITNSSCVKIAIVAISVQLSKCEVSSILYLYSALVLKEK